MSYLRRLDPLKEIGNNLRENMNRILEEGITSVSGIANIALDVYETDQAIVVKTSPLPGITAENAANIEVAILGDVLTIQGETQETESEDEANYLRRERRFGKFSRSVTIPKPVIAEEAVASFKDGMLTITVPKAEESRPQVINIETTDEA